MRALASLRSVSIDRDQARAGFKEPRQQFHDCGLAGPVMTKEPDDLTISNCEAIAISPPADCGLGHAWGNGFLKPGSHTRSRIMKFTSDRHSGRAVKAVPTF
jgi:hypothetical protein